MQAEEQGEVVNNATDLPTQDLIGNRYADATDALVLVSSAGTGAAGGGLRYREGWANATTLLPRGGASDDTLTTVDNDVFYLGKSLNAK